MIMQPDSINLGINILGIIYLLSKDINYSWQIILAPRSGNKITHSIRQTSDILSCLQSKVYSVWIHNVSDLEWIASGKFGSEQRAALQVCTTSARFCRVFAITRIEDIRSSLHFIIYLRGI